VIKPEYYLSKFIFRMKRAPQGETSGFCGTKTHLALSSQVGLHTFIRGVALVRKKREISLFRFPSSSLVLPFSVFDIGIS
jgi:hypothetical protein